MSDAFKQNNQMSILLTLVLVMLLAPIGMVVYFFDVGYWYANIMSMSWIANFETNGIFFRPDAIMILATLPFSFMRIGFVYMIWRAYEGKTTTRRALRVGVAMELWFSLLFYLPNLIALLLTPMVFMFWPLAIPLPILLVSGWLALRLSPPVGILTSWVDEEQPEQWWDEASNQ
ncbi:MAG: hypothetical protein ACW97O_14015 [Candidatus Thorarchaeota archaeon]